LFLHFMRDLIRVHPTRWRISFANLGAEEHYELRIAAAIEKLLVGVLEALLRQQVAVVGVVEGVGRRGVQRRHDVVPAAHRAGCLERRRE
jgi:hypothetical protein